MTNLQRAIDILVSLRNDNSRAQFKVEHLSADWYKFEEVETELNDVLILLDDVDEVKKDDQTRAE